jgi:hypothetical protein
MPIPQNRPAFNAGELSPSVWGRTELDKYGKGCSTQRNMFASYRGGANSRAGTKFVGQCKQSASDDPPVLIPFQFSVIEGIVLELGNLYMRFTIAGAYVTETPVSITAITQANPGAASVTNTWANGDWVYLSTPGMLQLSGRLVIVANRTGGTIQMRDPLTNDLINTTDYDAYTSGGTAARIYTLTTPYVSADLPAIKWAQSADVMTLVHPNYAPRDLIRLANDNWQLNVTTFNNALPAPASITASSTTTGTTYYQYRATAVDADTGEESVASPVAVLSSDNIGLVAGTITVDCAAVTGAGSYNFYRGPVSYTNPPQQGAIFGYLGSSFGPSFQDTNILPDYSVSPPIHANPFATSSIASVNMISGGTGYNTTSTAVSISGSTGSGFVGIPIVVNGVITWVATQTGGEGYTAGSTANFSGGGAGASASITIGPASGTYPSVVAYFQQRRVYANTLNQPDTYFASKPGAFTNFDTSVPVKDDDAIVGSPWSQQVNGIQWMINMPGGLVLLTGLGAWQLNGGAASTNAALTPSNQVATPQAYNGVSPLVRPITINYDILYVQEKGSIVRDLSYNFFVNIYTGTDMTVLSNHLFDGHTIERWDWSEEPFKLVWAVRDDGRLLCMTYLKEQDVYAWTRHDTNGLFQSVCSVSEPPVNATYFVVRRLIQNNGNPVYAYFQERMDDRFWETAEQSWCVDAGLSYPQNEPNATLAFSSATGVPTLDQPNLLYGGENYSMSTYARIDDPTGVGAVPTVTVTGGVITAAAIGGILTGYTNPTFVVVDPTNAGGGAVINLTINYVAEVASTPGLFVDAPGQGEEGDIVRGGGAVAVVAGYNSSTSLTVYMLRPVTEIIPNDPYNTPVPQPSGDWSITSPVSTLYGLNHLEGMTVSILADGIPVTPQVVENGSITLAEPASAIVVGLGFTVQLQTLYLEAPSQVTIQGRRKTTPNVVSRLENCGGPFQIGTNQPDASIQPDGEDIPWTNMGDQELAFSSLSPLQPFDLFTGDIFSNVFNQLGSDKGQVAYQQTLPIPFNILSVIVWADVGDQAGS